MIVAFVDDLMDRSRITAMIDGVTFQRAVSDSANADATVDVVIIDLAKHRATVPGIRVQYPNASLIGFAPHVDEVSTDAKTMGVDKAMPRSRFFHDVLAALTNLH